MELKKWWTGKEVRDEFEIGAPDLLSIVYEGDFRVFSETLDEISIDRLKGEIIPRAIGFFDEMVDSFLIPAEDIAAFKNAQKSPTHSDKDNQVFPCDPGTRWEDIKITLLSDEMVSVETPKGSGKFTYHELEMKDKRKGDTYTTLWALFREFARNQGFISNQTSEYRPELTDTAKRLNARLKQLFGIDDSIYKDHYKKERGYRTKIMFSDATNIIK